MNTDSLTIGVVSGLIAGVVILIGSWMLWLSRAPEPVRRESVQDLSHYGRRLDEK